MASSEEHTCAYCSTTKTVLWRRGWVEPGDATHTPVFLCNPCGLQYKLRKMPGHVPAPGESHQPHHQTRRVRTRRRPTRAALTALAEAAAALAVLAVAAAAAAAAAAKARL
jgi:hypothetical protein